MTQPPYTLYLGDCLDVLAELPEASVDSIVTDPPYELGFMGKKWDSSGVAFSVDTWRAMLRVLKPGGYLLAFGGSRTYHRMAAAIEDAGFEIRDQIMWLYGSGFPKSKNLDGDWKGWGTALKPAHEPIVMARKPLSEKTVTKNVLKHGTGALNIDAARIEFQSDADKASATPQGKVTSNAKAGAVPDVEGLARVEIERPDNSAGRWPANVIHDGSDEVIALFPDSKGGAFPTRRGTAVNTSFASGQETEGGPRQMGDDGSAARYFYCAKANKRDRNDGLDGFEEKRPDERTEVGMGHYVEKGIAKQSNHHPTVKPTALMRYLVRLITRNGGVVLDPFMGSGSTGKAAMLEGIQFIGIELDADYVAIAEARIRHALGNENK